MKSESIIETGGDAGNECYLSAEGHPGVNGRGTLNWERSVGCVVGESSGLAQAAMAPVALFVYNRPWHTQQTLEALRANDLAECSDLFIFSDAPKKPEAEQAVREVRSLIEETKGFRSVTVVQRERNLGLANSIIDGVTHLCSEYGAVIVLEDDLVTSPHFLRYMNDALARYKDEPQVMQISGHVFQIDSDIKEDAFFLQHTTSWGWGTWTRAWSSFDQAASGYEQLKSNRRLRWKFDMNGAYNYFNMLEKQLLGEIDSWAIRWYLSVFLENGLVLYPKNTLVENIGMDGSGVHCQFHSKSHEKISPDYKIKEFPALAVSECLRKEFIKYVAKSGGRRAGFRYLFGFLKYF